MADALTKRPADDMRDHLRRACVGELAIYAIGRSWNDVWAGNAEFEFADGAKAVIFNDCDEFDYVDRFVAVDGTRVDYPDTGDLRGIDVERLELVLQGAPVRPASQRDAAHG